MNTKYLLRAGWLGIAVVGYCGGAFLPLGGNSRYSDKSAAPSSCEATPPLTITLEPLSLTEKSFEVGVEYAAASDFSPKIAAYDVAILDSGGNQLQEHRRSEPVVDEVSDGVVPTTFTTPSNLKPGFYQARVGLVAADKEGKSEYVEDSFYIEVLENEVLTLTQEEWRIRSDYMLAQNAPIAVEDKATGTKDSEEE